VKNGRLWWLGCFYWAFYEYLRFILCPQHTHTHTHTHAHTYKHTPIHKRFAKVKKENLMKNKKRKSLLEEQTQFCLHRTLKSFTQRYLIFISEVLSEADEIKFHN